MIMRKNTIRIFAGLAVMMAGIFAFALWNTNYNAGPVHTVISGIAPQSDVLLEWAEFVHSEHGSLKRERRSITIQSDADGLAILPSLRQSVESYAIAFLGADGAHKTLVYQTGHDQGILRVSGNGFDEYESLKIEKNNQEYQTRLDWSGAFSREIAIEESDFTRNRSMRFAFMGQMAPDEEQLVNPNKTEVVVYFGGGPTDLLVNVYLPPIGTCTTVDNSTIFATSTCDIDRMEEHISDDNGETIHDNYVVAMMLMAEQFSAVMMQQMAIIGQFIDAKEQQETQRDFRRLVAEAHKDYHPSEMLCQYGGFTKSLAHTEESAALSRYALNDILLTHYRQPFQTSGETPITDIETRIRQYKDVYCDPNDFNGSLWLMCDGTHHDVTDIPASSGSDAERDRFNKDIEYFRTVGHHLTLDVMFQDSDRTDAEEDVIALAKNLYWPVVYGQSNINQYGPNPEDSSIYQARNPYLATRSLIAKTAVAHNSFAHIVAMKSRSSDPSTAPNQHGSSYMKALLQQFGMPDTEIHRFLGDNPSYYAQMEVLSKIMFQHPNFYTNLYDKPANVDRLNVVMETVKLMHARDRHEGLMRQEMLISQLVEQALRDETDLINQRILDLARDQYPPDADGF